MPAEVAERSPGRSGVRARRADEGQDGTLRADKQGAKVDRNGVVRKKRVVSHTGDRSGPDGLLVDLDRGR